MSDDVHYESKTVKAIRGMEARTVAKWAADGWELAGQVPGTISSDLSFRRVKRKLSRAVVAAAASIAALVVVAMTIGVITERNDSTSAAPPRSRAGRVAEPGRRPPRPRAPRRRHLGASPVRHPYRHEQPGVRQGAESRLLRRPD